MPYAAAHAALHPWLPELAVLMEDGALAVASLAVCQECVGLSVSELSAPLPLKAHVVLQGQELERVLLGSGAKLGATLREDGDLTLALAWGE